jgi:hypothetical protein
VTSLAIDTQGRAIKITRLSEEIQVFDSKLGKIQTLFQDDLKVCDRICEVRDALFRLESQMHGCEITEFCDSGMDDEADYQNTLNEMFWDQAKQDLCNYEQDETLEEENDD